MSTDCALGAGGPASNTLACDNRAAASVSPTGESASAAAGPASRSIYSGRAKEPTSRRHSAPSPDSVLRAFNTWAFKREQPSDPQLMRQVVSESIAAEAPLPFVLYWGKGPRSRLDEPDVKCLDHLTALCMRVRTVYTSGAAITLIFTDTHAELNGHSLQSTAEYFGAIDLAARERGFVSCRLSELLRNAQSAGALGPPDEPMSDELHRRLCICAAKWFHGEGTPEQGAEKYYQLNMMEKRAVGLAFPRSIFITFNGSEFRNIFPAQLPIFYMYSIRRGISVKPWFLPAAPAGLRTKAC
jgi:L-tyrosine isonitrile synthase